MYAAILGFITAFTLTYLIIPVIIRVARERRLYDRPNERSAHIIPTPSLGGIGIFAGTICGIVLWTPLEVFGVLQYIFAAFVLIFLIGVMDDLMPLSPTKKMLGQLLVAMILAYKANIRLNNFYGVLGVHELPELTGFVLSIVAIIGIINAFNLIDGINGLAGSIGLLACLCWGTWFLAVEDVATALVAFSLAGAIVAFLKYNLTPARIFMGDTGSLLIGMVCAILAIHFIGLNYKQPLNSPFRFGAAPAIALSVLIMPVFDTLRVFVIRLAHGKSPFHPDRNHIHHLLLDLGMSHVSATAVLVAATAVFISIAIALNSLGMMTVIGIELLLAITAVYLLNRLRNRKK